jgi:hypothetical protein
MSFMKKKLAGAAIGLHVWTSSDGDAIGVGIR